MQGDQQIDQIKKKVREMHKKALASESTDQRCCDVEYNRGYIAAVVEIKEFLKSIGGIAK